VQTIYLVPHSHYDVAWAFTKEDYLKINEAILQKAVDLMKSSEEYKFSWEQIFPLKVDRYCLLLLLVPPLIESHRC